MREVQNRPEVKAKISEALTGKVFSEERKKHLSKVNKIAQNRPEVKAKISKALTGKKHSEEWKEAQSKRMMGKQYAKGYKHTREAKRRIREALTGKSLSEEHREKLSESKKLSWQNPEYVQKQKEARNIKPNILEQKLGEILQQILPDEYKYVGDFSLTIGGRNPDFVNVNSQKKIIELFGDYWHEGDDGKERTTLFKQYGYDTLIVWERELYDVESLKKRILKFHNWKRRCWEKIK